MARTIAAIQTEIFDSIAANEKLVGLTTTSKVSIWRLMVFVVAFSIWVLENLFDTHTKEVDDIIEAKMPHRASWYRTKAKDFQDGFDLIADSDQYDNTGFDAEVIESKKIIKHAAVTTSAGQIFIKIATETAGVLAPITAEEKERFDFYISEIADCGVKYVVINHEPDILTMNLQIFRNPLVLDATGKHVRNQNYPVQEAIDAFMKELPFNGQLVLAHLIDAIQKVEGVAIPHLVGNVTVAAIDVNSNPRVYKDPVIFSVKTIPESGYFKLSDEMGITYTV